MPSTEPQESQMPKTKASTNSLSFSHNRRKRRPEWRYKTTIAQARTTVGHMMHRDGNMADKLRGGRALASARVWQRLALLLCCILSCDPTYCSAQITSHLRFALASPSANQNSQLSPTGSAHRLATRQTAVFDEPLQADGESSQADERPAPAGHMRHLDRASISNQHSSKLRITRLFAPESVQNGTQNVTLDCMFKFDPKLDQRLTIKWFFEDELEPIYQWIPELNKRVYSDKYEHLIDKSYQVTEDVDWMLQSYKWLLNGDSLEPMGNSDEVATVDESISVDSAASSRKLLAHRLSRVAKLGGENSKQLLRSLRQALAMDKLEFSKYRALRLLEPTLEMSGRFTCSISSLESDDLQYTRLVVYEPPRSFSLNVSRTLTPNQFNLTCRAGPTFPRPSLALFRYRAGQAEPAAGDQAQQIGHAHRPRLAATSLRQEPLPGTQTQITITAASRPAHGRFPVSDQLEVSQSSNGLTPASLPAALEFPAAKRTMIALDEVEFPSSADVEQEAPGGPGGSRAGAYEIVAWALVDESTLSSNLITQFECLLTIEGTNYEQRQTLALQKGWHVNSQALLARSTLVGFMSVLASVLCLTVALVSALLVFRLMRRHANKSARVHQTDGDPSAGHKRSLAASASVGQTNRSCDVDSASSPSTGSTATSNSGSSGAIDALDKRNLAGKPITQLEVNGLSSPTPPQTRANGYSRSRSDSRFVQYSSFDASRQQLADTADQQSDGIYRVPDSLNANVYHQQQQQYSSFGMRHSAAHLESVMTPGGGWSSSTFSPGSNQYATGRLSVQSASNNGVRPANSGLDEPLERRAAGGILRNPTSGAQNRSIPAIISVNGKQLYC